MSYDTILPAVGGSLAAGKAYHDIPGVDGPTYRSSSQARADQIADWIDVHDRVGVDLGCSVGGVSFGLVKHGARMLGVDHDETAIRVANDHAGRHTLNAWFTVGDLASDECWADLLGEIADYDFAIWLANWMWVAKAAGIDKAKQRLADLCLAVPVLAFETAQGVAGSMAGTFGMHTNDDVADLLHGAGYTDVCCVPVVDGWHDRSLFIARRT